MQDKCDILILTASFGSGHSSVSKAITEYVHSHDSTLIIKTKDLYEIINPLFNKSMYKGYELLVRYGYKVYNYEYYRKNNNQNLRNVYTSSKRSLNKLDKYINEVKPGLIISTFPSCSGYISRYKKMYEKTIPLVTCITDVVDSDEWLYDETDIYFVAVEEIKNRLINKGVNKDKVMTTGIPIRSNFIVHKNKTHIKEALGFAKEDKVILIMGGSLGIIPEDEAFYKWLKKYNKLKVVILTGKNKKLFKKLNKYNKIKNIQVIDYTDKVADFMKAADLLITKAGGISLFEAIASKLPFIVYNAILGQELENCKFIKKHHIGLVSPTMELLKSTINEMLSNEDKYIETSKKLIEMSRYIDMDKMATTILSIYYNTNDK